jgi:SAM-dependent methyltransferase
MAAPVSPLERQQLESARAARATYWHRVRFELVGREATALGATGVLDVGAGAGLLGGWVAAHRPELEYRFEETSPVLRDHLVARFGAAGESDPDAPVPSSTMVVLLDVLEHIDDDAGALAGLRDRMAPGGAIVITVPAMQWAFSSWDTELGHHRRYSRRRLRDDLTAAGFDVRSVSYLFPELFPMLLVRRLRRGPRGQVDFPVLSPKADAVGHAVASATTATRRLWPFGTSAVAIATRRP